MKYSQYTQFRKYIIYPDSGLTQGKNARLYCFSNYYIRVKWDPGVRVVMTINDMEFVRYTNEESYAIFYITPDILKTFFDEDDLGAIYEYTQEGQYFNSASKIYKKGINIKIETPDVSWTKTYDIIYGAVQLGEDERSELTIYKFGDLPLYLTQTVGHWCNNKNDGPIQSNSVGKEMDVQKALTANIPTPFLFKQEVPDTLGVNETVKTIYVKDMKSCGNGVYLRWISENEGYKYFFFNKAEQSIVVEDKKSINQMILGDDNDMTVLKKQSKTFTLSATEASEYSIKSADVEMQKFIFDLQHALHVWAYIGDDRWQEVDIEVEPYTIDYKKSRKEISVKVLKQLYTQSL